MRTPFTIELEWNATSEKTLFNHMFEVENFKLNDEKFDRIEKKNPPRTQHCVNAILTSTCSDWF